MGLRPPPNCVWSACGQSPLHNQAGFNTLSDWLIAYSLRLIAEAKPLYSESDYAYGTKANQFLMEQKHRLEPGMKTLVVGDGEGRNGVWLALQGLDVLSVDLSPVGLRKAEALADRDRVKIKTLCADLTSWQWSQATYDLVVAIYVHFDPKVRQRMHRSMLKALKPGGLLILEAFNPKQLQYQTKYNSGGPKISEMLYQPEMLQTDFAGGKILELTETITELREGEYHWGKASVIRLVLQRFDDGTMKKQQ